MTNLVKSLLSKEDLHDISKFIGEQERSTSGEIRVAIRQRRSRSERGLSVEELARREFVSLEMTKTVSRTGILIFMLLEDRQFFILADEGIHAKVKDDTWKSIVAEMSKHFADKKFREGIRHGIQSVGSVLTKHFPQSSGDRNELPNSVRIK
jgi:uncharacterized membrane protein